MNYTKKLNEVRKSDLKIAGGKASNLGEMIHAGLPVPGGFVVLTNAYLEFIKQSNLDKKIKLLLKNADEEKLDAVSKKIKSLFEQQKIPENIKQEIKKAYNILKYESVVVRSSATAEDLPGLSFAGQYNTYLNIKGYESLELHIKKCWASLWNARAISYRIKQKIHSFDIAHGVIVQELISSKKSGILFTANPLNGRRDEILINSSWGLGEAIVGGDVNPDQWIINKNTKKATSEIIANKEVMSIQKKEGITLVKVPSSLKNKETLNKEEQKELLELAIKTENYYKEPQDLEWAFDEKFYLVQTRPITSIYPIPKKQVGRDGLRIYLNINNYSQAMKEPFTTMGEDLITMAIKKMMTKYGRRKLKQNSLWWYHITGGRIFIDITAFLRKEKFQNKLKKPNPADKDPITTKILLQLCEKHKEELGSIKEKISFKKLFNLRLLKLALGVSAKFMCGVFSPIKARKKSEQARINAINKIKKESLSQKTKREKINFVKNNIESLLMAGATTLFYVTASSTYIEKAKAQMLKYLGSAKELDLVEKSIPHSKTTQMGLDLLKLAKNYDEQKKKPKINDDKIKKFLEVYGHKKTVELDIGTPVWEDEPKYVLDLISGYMENKIYEKKLAEFFEGEKNAIQAIEDIKRKFEEKGMRRKARKIAKILYAFREMFGMREESKFTITQGLLIFRKLMLEVGAELVKENKLNKDEDIFFLRFEDISSSDDLKELVEKNKEEYFLNAKLNAPRVLLSTGESLYSATSKKKEGELEGIPVSPGICEGVVRVLESPEQGRELKKGEILVTTGTNPAWTPLFLKISGLVMETGGPISHGSVVAREYGIPAVSGIVNATKDLKTGQRIKMNGETGIIEIIN